MKRLLYGVLPLLLVLAVLAGCSGTEEEIATMTPTGEHSELPTTPVIKTYTVSTVDEFLAALNSNTVIELSDTTFRLDQAGDYGQDSRNPAYYWEETPDGYELVLNHLHDLTIRATEPEETALLSSPRYSSLLVLNGCKRITLEGFTVGHTEDGEACTGGVLRASGCKDLTLQNMGLFGCGIQGILADRCQRISLDHCRIYDCSQYGISGTELTELRISSTDFYAIGTPQIPAFSILSLSASKDVTLEDCSITENQVNGLMELYDTDAVILKNTEFRANTVLACAFDFQLCSPELVGCSLEGNDIHYWYTTTSQMARNEKGELLGSESLPEVTPIPEDSPREIISVSTVDEFLAAIGSNREIVLKGKEFDLSTAGEYGEGSGLNYYWDDIYDGPGLVINDVSNLTIRAEDEEITATTLSAVPRYANVLSFRNCTNLRIEGFTAGHTELPGQCSGGVLYFSNCQNVLVKNCGLFGCGILGVETELCQQITISDCDIYDCSFGGIQLNYTTGAHIKGNRFRDLGGPQVMTYESRDIDSDITLNDYGEPLN